MLSTVLAVVSSSRLISQRCLVAALLVGLAAAPPVIGAAQAAQSSNNPVTCNGKLPFQNVRKGGGGSAGQQPDLLVSKPCTVSSGGTYQFGNVNIVAGGSLTFTEPSGNGTEVDFWASNIIVEAGGSLIAGSATAPYGSRRGVLNIYLYGKNQSTGDPAQNPGQGALCQSQLTGSIGPCGIPLSLWNDNGTTPQSMPGVGSISDYFYQYGPNYGDNLCSDGKTQWNSNTQCGTGKAQVGYFGYKVLAVSYNGTLQLFGYKGTPLPKAPPLRRGFSRFFGGQSAFNSQGTMGAPAQSGNSTTANKSFSFLDWVKGHNGGNGGGSGGGSGGGLGGANGTCAADVQVGTRMLPPDDVPTSTACSWMRLAANLPNKSKPNQLTLSLPTADRWWSAQDNPNTPDQVVVTTTDYLPGHSEKLTISGLTGTTLSFLDAVKYPHNGTRYPIASRLDSNTSRFQKAGMDPDLINNGAETRAAVALLTRSIRILSAGDSPGQTWQQAPSSYYFGAHTIFRQGFKQVQIQGVQFVNMGQGGKLGHYPVHFHMARHVPADTFIKDSVIDESMTRWIVLHATQGVLLQRNIGWKSIGHGFFLESGTETDNKLYSNLGIFARAAISNPQNPRMVPGIFSAGHNFTNGNPLNTYSPNAFPFASDIQQPTVFWISNGWNEFVGNMAAGAGACGAAYWFIPAQNNDMPDVPIPGSSGNTWFEGEMKWQGSPTSTTTTSYAGLQNSMVNAGTTPLKVFYGNYATSTMNSFETVVNIAPCAGIDYPGAPPDGNFKNSHSGYQWLRAETEGAQRWRVESAGERDLILPLYLRRGTHGDSVPADERRRGLQCHHGHAADGGSRIALQQSSR